MTNASELGSGCLNRRLWTDCYSSTDNTIVFIDFKGVLLESSVVKRALVRSSGINFGQVGSSGAMRGQEFKRVQLGPIGVEWVRQHDG